MEFISEEEPAHVLVHQVSQRALIEILRLQLVDESTEHARLAPLKQTDPQVSLLFPSLQGVDLSFLLLNGRLHAEAVAVVLLRRGCELVGEELLLVLGQFLLLLLEVLLLLPLLSVKLISQPLELVVESLVPLPAPLEHLFYCKGSCIDSIVDHFNQLFISVILISTELLGRLLNDCREMISWKGGHKSLPYRKSKRLNHSDTLENLLH